MKKLIALFTIALSMSTMAATSIQSGSVIDTYKTVIKQIPYRVEVCQDRVQKSGDGSATNELVGALFGGAIGNSFGKGDGKDAMTLFGALMGASLAHDDELANNPGTKTVTVCDVQTRYEEEVSEVYSHSTITFRLEGRNYSLDFLK
jgi:uncharacterized protein YcfJ|tara:strand:+ start:532 stop:972 length:441 start_codon:yes stop_codon:yes gene_type:complete